MRQHQRRAARCRSSSGRRAGRCGVRSWPQVYPRPGARLLLHAPRGRERDVVAPRSGDELHLEREALGRAARAHRRRRPAGQAVRRRAARRVAGGRRRSARRAAGPGRRRRGRRAGRSAPRSRASRCGTRPSGGGSGTGPGTPVAVGAPDVERELVPAARAARLLDLARRPRAARPPPSRRAVDRLGLARRARAGRPRRAGRAAGPAGVAARDRRHAAVALVGPGDDAQQQRDVAPRVRASGPTWVRGSPSVPIGPSSSITPVSGTRPASA